MEDKKGKGRWEGEEDGEDWAMSTIGLSLLPIKKKNLQ